MDIYAELRDLGVGNKLGMRQLWDWCDERQKQNVLKEVGYTRIADEIGVEELWDWCNSRWFKNKRNSMLKEVGYTRIANEIGMKQLWDWFSAEHKNTLLDEIGYDRAVAEIGYEFTSSGILCTNHINCRDQLCVNLDTGELIRDRYDVSGSIAPISIRGQWWPNLAIRVSSER